MSTFYLLPPRSLVADHLANSLQICLPGMDLTSADRLRLSTKLIEELQRKEVYVVHRDELPASERAEQALVDGFGAGEGDEIVEVRATARPGEFSSRRWRIEGID